MSSESVVAHANQLHAKAIVFDGLMPWGNLDHPECVAEAQAGGVTAANVTVAHYPHNWPRAMEAIRRYTAVVDAHPDVMLLAKSSADVREAKESGKVGVVLGFQDTTPFENQLGSVDEFVVAGVRIVQLTYNTQNFVGSGCCESHYGPLTMFGRELLLALQQNGVAIDLSHCSDETTDDALRHAKGPVFFTHSGVRSLCPAYGRNKTDDQIRRLADGGGVMGICLAPFLLKRDLHTHDVLPVTLDDVIDQIEYVGELVGLEHVGFGSDLVSAWLRQHRTPPESSLRWWREARPDVFGRGPTEHYDPYPEGLRNHNEVPNLTRRLLERGFSDEDILNVVGGNFFRALSRVWLG